MDELYPDDSVDMLIDMDAAAICATAREDIGSSSNSIWTNEHGRGREVVRMRVDADADVGVRETYEEMVEKPKEKLVPDYDTTHHH